MRMVDNLLNDIETQKKVDKIGIYYKNNENGEEGYIAT